MSTVKNSDNPVSTSAVSMLFSRPELRAAILSVVKVGLAFAAGVVYSRALGPAGRGQVALVVTLGALFAMVAGAGLIPAIRGVRSESPDPLERAVFRLVVERCIVVGVVGVLAGLLLTTLLDRGPSAGELLIGALLSGLVTWTTGLSGTSGSDLRAPLFLSLAIVGSVVFLGLVTVGSVFDGLSPSVVIMAWAFGASVPIAIYLRVPGRDLGSQDPVRRLRSLALQVSAAELALFITWRVDVLLIEALAGVEEVGRYSVVASIAEVMMAAVAGLRLAAVGRRGGINGRAALRHTVVMTFAIGGPASIAAALVGPAAVRLLFGTAFDVDPEVLWLLLPGTLVFGVSFMLLDQLTSVVAAWKLTATCGFGLVTNIVLDLFTIPRFGIAGAAASSTISYVVPFAILLVLARSALPRTLEQDLS